MNLNQEKEHVEKELTSLIDKTLMLEEALGLIEI